MNPALRDRLIQEFASRHHEVVQEFIRECLRHHGLTFPEADGVVTAGVEFILLHTEEV
jgi:hypothetical protein